MKAVQYKNYNYTLIKHSIEFIFWVSSYFVLINMFAGSHRWLMIDHIYTSFFIGTIILAVTVNTWALIPYFLKQRKYFQFVVLWFVNVFVMALFNEFFFSKIIDYILPGYYFISYYEYIDLVKFFFAFTALATLMELSFEWFQLQETKQNLILLEKEKAEAEFKALTNQVNPHFLFNSLTVLYSLSLKNSPDTSSAIIKLSDILRYVIYESATGKVSIGNEVKIIRDYIDLQLQRINPATVIDFDTRIEDENIPIVPMLLLPLVENSFKHGAKGDVENTFIRMQLHVTKNEIHFKIANNKSNGNMPDGYPGGIGLANIRSRLDMMYHGLYNFDIDKSGNVFSVDLKLRVS